jgi:arsenate-mycothiol transferase
MNQPMAPSVLFVCVKNSGKSQMAAGLMRKIAGDSVHVYSAGTQPGNGINKLSAESLTEVGVDISDETPQPIDRKLHREVDFIITLGRDADLEPVSGASTKDGIPTSHRSAESMASNECAWCETTLRGA